jgi:hypothetical protein
VLSSIFIALLQAAAGDPAAATEATAEAPAASTEAAPRTQTRRVCRTYEAGTGGRLAQRRCRNVEVPIRDNAEAADAPSAVTNTESAATSPEASTESAAADAGDIQTGGEPVAASPAPSPQ